MLKISLNQTQKKMFGEKIVDLAHLIAGGFVIGQFISDRPFSYSLAAFGIVLLVFLYWLSYNFTKKRKK